MNKFNQIKLNVINLDWIRFTSPVSTRSHNSFDKQSLMQIAAWTQNSQEGRKRYLNVIYPTAKWTLEALWITYWILCFLVSVETNMLCTYDYQSFDLLLIGQNTHIVSVFMLCSMFYPVLLWIENFSPSSKVFPEI